MANKVNDKSFVKLKKKKKNIISRFDYLGDEFTFNYEDSPTFQTICGGLISILIILIVLATSWITIAKLWDETNPEVSISQITGTDPPLMNLYEEGLSFAFGSYLDPNIIKPAEMLRYFTPIGMSYEMELVDIETGLLVPKVKDIVTFVKCQDLVDKASIRHYDKDPEEKLLANTFGLCPNINNETDWTLKGKLAQPPIHAISLSIYPCSLPNPGDCATAAELNRLVLQITRIQKDYDPTDKKDPVRYIPTFDEGIHLNTEVTKFKQIQFKENEIWDDTLDFFEPTLRAKFINSARELSDFAKRSDP